MNTPPSSIYADFQKKHERQPTKILTVKQISEFLQTKQSTVYAWAEQGLIPSFKINGLLRFDEAEVIEWVKGCKRPGRCYNVGSQTRARKGGKN
ncbi:MAG: Helix-turn-helix domain protein [Syntrophorhabdaceae bacterium PtaU1.Bin034]|nr:MAG: Helix-turn-helix domain protein [Syntrophorhabdaceae bacterium PtaU1.Bin034]